MDRLNPRAQCFKILFVALVLVICFLSTALASMSDIFGIIIANPATSVANSALSDAAGYNGVRQYLVLFADSTEPRMIAGFTGWYGIVKVSQGNVELAQMTPDIKALGRTYDIDAMIPTSSQLPAPMPVSKSSEWFPMRDTLAWPDMPYCSSWTYDRFSAAVNSGVPWRPEPRSWVQMNSSTTSFAWPSGLKKINGLVVISSEAFKDYLKTTGAMTIHKSVVYNGNHYPISVSINYLNADYIINQYSNAEKFWGTVSDYQLGPLYSYAFFNELVSQITARLNTPGSNNRLLLTNFFLRSLQRKNIVINMKGYRNQQAMKYLGWAGELKPKAGDFLGVFDDGYGSYIARAYTSRTICYRVSFDGAGRPIGLVESVYANAGAFPSNVYQPGEPMTSSLNGWYYQAYMNVCTPAGSKFISSRYRTKPIPDLQITDAKPTISFYNPNYGMRFGKNFFSGWFKVKPGDRKNIWFKYWLPQSVLSRSSRGGIYKLYFQKQPGSKREGFNFYFTPPADLKVTSTSIQPKAIYGRTLLFKTDSLVDRNFIIKMSKI